MRWEIEKNKRRQLDGMEGCLCESSHGGKCACLLVRWRAWPLQSQSLSACVSQRPVRACASTVGVMGRRAALFLDHRNRRPSVAPAYTGAHWRVVERDTRAPPLHSSQSHPTSLCTLLALPLLRCIVPRPPITRTPAAPSFPDAAAAILDSSRAGTTTTRPCLPSLRPLQLLLRTATTKLPPAPRRPLPTQSQFRLTYTPTHTTTGSTALRLILASFQTSRISPSRYQLIYPSSPVSASVSAQRNQLSLCHLWRPPPPASQKLFLQSTAQLSALLSGISPFPTRSRRPACSSYPIYRPFVTLSLLLCGCKLPGRLRIPSEAVRVDQSTPETPASLYGLYPGLPSGPRSPSQSRASQEGYSCMLRT